MASLVGPSHPEYALVEEVVPVPMTAAKLRARGFNHAAEIGAALAHQLGIPFEDVMAMPRDPAASQHRLGLAQRLENVRGCYAVAQAGRVHGKRVLLVDNIYTTGSTVLECSRVLREAGARAIYVLTAGRAVGDFALPYIRGYQDG